MTAQTIQQRVARYTKRQKAKGVVRVTVYVPAKFKDIILKRAAELRRTFKE